MPGIYEMIVIMGILFVTVVLSVIPFWMICTKAGFPGALSLLRLVPIANVVLPFYIAFAEWPVLRQPFDDHGQ
ncbi:MAG: hypothetical protein ACYTAS_03905 [Planctomycetota bacterium]|jgi:hypothetical protein